MHIIDAITFIVCIILIISLFGCTVYKISNVATNNQTDITTNNKNTTNTIIKQQKSYSIPTQENINIPTQQTIANPSHLYDSPMCGSDDVDKLINDYIKSATIVSF